MEFSEAIELVQANAADGEVDALLVELLRAPSPQTERLESDPALRAFVRKIVSPRLEALTGAEPAIDAMGNLVLKTGAKGDAGGLVLMGYTMTFPPASMAGPYAGNIVSGEPFGVHGQSAIGRGACEQKGPLAAMIGAAAILARARVDLRRPFYLVVSLAGETGRHDAAKYIVENHPIRAAHGIVGLGTSNRVCLGNKGRLDIEIVVHGKSCHSSTPWAGIDAIKGARLVLDKLDSLALGPAHARLGVATLTPTRIESGPPISHTLQETCKLVLDRRLLPGEEPDRALDTIRAAVAELQPWSIEVLPGALMYPSEVASECAVATAVRQAGEAVTGRAAEPFYSAAALDAGYLNRAGIETVMFGPGDLRFAHTDQEMVSLAEVRDAARIYAATALRLLA
jgi:acetylornithine deacetylase